MENQPKAQREANVSDASGSRGERMEAKLPRQRKMKQVHIHDMFSRERWAGALMEVRSLFDLNSAVKKNALRTDGLTDGPTDGRTDPNIESLVRD